VEPQLSYKKTVGEGVLDVLLGSTFQETTRDASLLYATGYDSDALLENSDAAALTEVQSATDIQYRYQAFLRQG